MLNAPKLPGPEGAATECEPNNTKDAPPPLGVRSDAAGRVGASSVGAAAGVGTAVGSAGAVIGTGVAVDGAATTVADGAALSGVAVGAGGVGSTASWPQAIEIIAAISNRRQANIALPVNLFIAPRVSLGYGREKPG